MRVKRSIEELIVAAARGEPLAVAERARLDRALEDGAAGAALAAQRALGADLAALRAGLDALPLPDDERALRAAFRHAHAARRLAVRRRGRLALGAGALAVAIAAVGVWRAGDERPAPEVATSAVVRDSGDASAAIFHAWPYASGMSLTGSYSVVRVRLPVSSLAASVAPSSPGVIEADVLLGEDGIVRAIRFDDANGEYRTAHFETARP